VTWRVLVLRTLLCLSLDALTRLGPNEFGHSRTFLECSGRAWELVRMLAQHLVVRTLLGIGPDALGESGRPLPPRA
jgi:hypothetical protein